TEQLTARLTAPGSAPAILAVAVALQLEKGSRLCELFAQVYPVFSTPCVYVIRSGVCMDIVRVDPAVPSEEELRTRILAHAPTASAVAGVSAQPTSALQQAPSTIAPSDGPGQAGAATPTPAPSTAAAAPRPATPTTTSSAAVPRAAPPRNRTTLGTTVTSAAAPATQPKPSSSGAVATKPAAPVAENPKSHEPSRRSQMPPNVQGGTTNPATPPPGTAAPSPTPGATIRYDSSALSIRLFDGSTLRNRFKAEETLKDVRKYINNEAKVSSFDIFLLYPRTLLTDEAKTLKELDLVPSASLVLRPSSAVAKAYKSRPTTGIAGLVLAPFSLVVSLISAVLSALNRLLFAPTVGDGGPPRAPPPADSVASAGAAPAAGPSSRSWKPRDDARAVRTLADVSTESEDEERKNTYNGNSTSQGW
ncbi:hypothetical protein HK405_007518, partial [Cladochytrium tenue]